MEHSVDVNGHVNVVVRALTVVGHKELAIGVDREVCNDAGGGGRHLSCYLGALPLDGSLPWNRLCRGRHGGVVVVVGGSVFVGGSIFVRGSVVGDGVVVVGGEGRRQRVSGYA